MGFFPIFFMSHSVVSWPSLGYHTIFIAAFYLIWHYSYKQPCKEIGCQCPDERISGIETWNFPIQSWLAILLWIFRNVNLDLDINQYIFR